MTPELQKLCFAALTIGTLHTLMGPDHYLPFVAMARARQWSLRKALSVTVLCGAGHVGSSMIVGLVGVGIGAAVFSVEAIEAARGRFAGWILLAFGLAYFVWGLRTAAKNRPHTHLHVHADGTSHVHEHVHRGEHLHVHATSTTVPESRGVPVGGGHGAARRPLTPWILFVIFLFGPCEALIPLLIYPAAQHHWIGVALVTTVFALATLTTMVAAVGLLYVGAAAVRIGGHHRYAHAASGFVVMLCGAAVMFGL